jgi:hypothetical protein
MPSKNGVGRRNGRDPPKRPTPKPVPQFGEAAPLGIIKRSRRPSSRALRTRFSSRKNAMMLSCSCRSRLHNIATKNWNGNTSEVCGSGARFSFGTVRRREYMWVLILHANPNALHPV